MRLEGPVVGRIGRGRGAGLAGPLIALAVPVRRPDVEQGVVAGVPVELGVYDVEVGVEQAVRALVVVVLAELVPGLEAEMLADLPFDVEVAFVGDLGRLVELTQPGEVAQRLGLHEGVELGGQAVAVDRPVGPLVGGAQGEGAGEAAVEARPEDVLVRTRHFTELAIDALLVVRERERAGVEDVPVELGADVVVLVGVGHRDAGVGGEGGGVEDHVAGELDAVGLVVVVVVAIAELQAQAVAEGRADVARDVEHVGLLAGVLLRQVRRVAGVELGAVLVGADDARVDGEGEQLVVLRHLGVVHVTVRPPVAAELDAAGEVGGPGVVVRRQVLDAPRLGAGWRAQRVVPDQGADVVLELRIAVAEPQAAGMADPLAADRRVVGLVVDRLGDLVGEGEAEGRAPGLEPGAVFVLVVEGPAQAAALAEVEPNPAAVPLQSEVDARRDGEQRGENRARRRRALGRDRGLDRALRGVGDLVHAGMGPRVEGVRVVAEAMLDLVVVEQHAPGAGEPVLERVARVVAAAVEDRQIERAVAVLALAEQVEEGNPEAAAEVAVLLELGVVTVGTVGKSLQDHRVEREREGRLLVFRREGGNVHDQEAGQAKPEFPDAVEPKSSSHGVSFLSDPAAGSRGDCCRGSRCGSSGSRG